MSLSSETDQHLPTAIDWTEARRFMRSQLRRKLSHVDESQIDDLTQEAAVRLLRAVRGKGIRSLPAVMHTIALRTGIDFLRRRRRMSLLFEPMSDPVLNRPASGTQNPYDLGDPQERVSFVVLEFFRKKNPDCRKLAAFFFQRRDWQNVAAEIGISYVAVRARWSRCVASLRQELAEDPEFQLLADWAGN